jgi:hypothetical protein
MERSIGTCRGDGGRWSLFVTEGSSVCFHLPISFATGNLQCGCEFQCCSFRLHISLCFFEGWRAEQVMFSAKQLTSEHIPINLIGKNNSVEIRLASFMDRNPPWGPNNLSFDHEISCLWCNPKVHYRAYNNSPLVPIVIAMNLGHIVGTYLFKIHFNITHASTPMSPK